VTRWSSVRVDVQPISLRPDESQFLETQQANISEIARFFGIPAEMVGGKTGSSLTYANVEQRSLDFLTYGVAFWLKRIEDAFFDLLPQPQFVKFDTGRAVADGRGDAGEGAGAVRGGEGVAAVADLAGDGRAAADRGREGRAGACAADCDGDGDAACESDGVVVGGE
jgi:hypothetical protein